MAFYLLLCGMVLSACGSALEAQISSESTKQETAGQVDDAEADAGKELMQEEETDTPQERYQAMGADYRQVMEFGEEIAKEHKIPVLHITTKDGAEILSLEEYVDCVADFFGAQEYDLGSAAGGIRVRGNSTAYYGDVEEIRKNGAPYRLKFDQKVNMLGLNDGAKCKSWVLLKTGWNLIPDYMGLSMGRILLGDIAYSSDCTIIQVYINQNYAGLYLLCEQNQVNKNRVAVREPEKDYLGTDIGYLVEIDNYADSDEHPFFMVDYCQGVVEDVEGVTRAFVPADYSIKSDVYGKEQKNYIRDYVRGCFQVLYEAGQGNYLTLDAENHVIASEASSAYEAVSAVIDVDSLVNMYILYELVNDNDCGEGSFYMCVDASENSNFPRLTFTAPWDFNWAYEGEPAGQYYAAAFDPEDFVEEMGDRSNPWFITAMSQEWFQSLVKHRWNSLMAGGELQKLIKETYEMVDTYREDYSKQIDYATYCGKDLLDWLEKRIEWLNENWVAL